jgi:hypothetical protein
MHKKLMMTLLLVTAWVTASCSTSETPREIANPPAAEKPTATPAQQPDDLKEIQQQRTGDYVVVVLNKTGNLTQGPNNLTLEFRRSSDNQLADVGNVRVRSTMEMKGMSPMMANTNVTPSGTPGRYNITAEISMAGDWKTVVTFGENQQVQFDLNAK